MVRHNAILGFKFFENSEGKTKMIEVKFTGDPEELQSSMVEFLKKTRPDIEGIPSQHLNHPHNVTKQLIYEPVRSDANFNDYYIVTIINDTLPIACTCKDFHFSIRKKRDRGDRHPLHTCKHINQARERFRRF